MKASVVRGGQERVLLKRCGPGQLVVERRGSNGWHTVLLCALSLVFGFMMSQVFSGTQVDVLYIPTGSDSRWSQWRGSAPSKSQSTWSGPSNVQDSLLLSAMLNIARQQLFSEIEQEGFIVVEGDEGIVGPLISDQLMVPSRGDSQSTLEFTGVFWQEKEPMGPQGSRPGTPELRSETPGLRSETPKDFRNLVALLDRFGVSSDWLTSQIQEPSDENLPLLDTPAVVDNAIDKVPNIPDKPSEGQTSDQTGTTSDEDSPAASSSAVKASEDVGTSAIQDSSSSAIELFSMDDFQKWVDEY